MKGIIAAHDPLQGGKLADHAGGQVGLGQASGGAHLVFVGVRDRSGQIGGQSLHAVDLFIQVAELGVEDHVRQGRGAAGQRLLAVLVPEELGIRQTGAEHPFVTRRHRLAAVLRFRVGDDDETGRQLAVGIQAGEIFLMAAHGCGQHFRRHVHESVIDGTHQHHRPFDQPGDFVQQTRIVLHRQPFGGGQLVGFGLDQLAALGRVEHDLGGGEFLLVVGKVFDFEGIGREETMADGGRPRQDAAEIKGHRLAIEDTG